jgi:anti-sigma factor RsiW
VTTPSKPTRDPHSERSARPDFELKDEENLVAYLDGELDFETSQKIEHRLARDADYRQRLQQLQRAWDLMDALPRVHAGQSFAKTTMELVAIKAEQDVDSIATRSRKESIRRWIAGIVATLAATVGSFELVQLAVTAPDRQLLNDLPIIERVTFYQMLDSPSRQPAEAVEFLKLLAQENLFREESPDEE